MENVNPTVTTQGGNVNRQLGYQETYKFSPDELRVLKKCSSESFYQRSLPIGTLLGLGTYLSIQHGYIKPSLRFGAYPKVSLAVFAGYFIGKLSYQQKCAEKLMALPNSQLGEILRQRKSKGYRESLTLDPGFSTTSGLDFYQDIPPQQTHLDLDSDRPYQAGLSEFNKPRYDDYTINEEEIQLPINSSQKTTYEDLRRKNREEYEQQKTKVFRPILSEDAPPVIRQRTPPPSQQTPTSKTKYGDVWEQ